MKVTKPITEEQRKRLEQPTDDQLRAAQDELFLNLLKRVAELERERDG